MRNITCSALALAVLLLLASGCDSGDPVDEPHPRDVAGVYTFTEFIFQPSGQAVQPIVVLDTLEQSQTNLRLSSGGEFSLTYQFVNGDLYFPSGEFTVSAQSVRLTVSEGARDHFQRLLLPDRFALRRSVDDPNLLTAEIPQTINPSEFSDRYEGVEEMTGTMRLRLVKE